MRTFTAAPSLNLAIPGYTFATPVLGGQFSVFAAIPYGRMRAASMDNDGATWAWVVRDLRLAGALKKRSPASAILPDGYAALEFGRQQLHDLPDRQL